MANNNIAKYFTVDKRSLKLNAEMMHLTIPKEYFTRGFVEFDGSKLEILGLLENIKIYTDVENDKYEDFTMLLPMVFTTVPTSISESKLLVGEVVHEVVTMEYERGSVFMESVALVQDSSTVSLFMHVLLGAFMPRFIPYEKILEIWDECAALNGVKISVPSTIKGLVVANLCRYKKDTSKTFSDALNVNPNLGAEQMTMIKIESIAHKLNTYASLSSPYAKDGLTESLMRKGNVASSPVEDTVLG